MESAADDYTLNVSHIQIWAWINGLNLLIQQAFKKNDSKT